MFLYKTLKEYIYEKYNVIKSFIKSSSYYRLDKC
ncbi:hypothetical protein HH_1562 [Helicobacter hepaticus ATCC 51449]|uniref:Uncharacterized protein n=1 Tax=Helicobacter hepaticus (strain ATCC 51449 / 3B1) TaxID=235279 RepID=Q7VFW3_HELHP|nr:hypothetical protein HH_1562 [Helicobacter hepaticus ATCC 51449]